MEQGALGGFVLLCLFGVISVSNEDDVTHCWVKGKEVTVSPLQCPAEFDGADAKICCRVCYGANCCLPRKPRVNQNKCPRGARLAKTILDRVAAPGAKVTAFPEKKEGSGYVALGLVLMIVVGLVVAGVCWCLRRKWCESLWERAEERSDDWEERWIPGRGEAWMPATVEDWLRSSFNARSCRVLRASLPRTAYPPPPPPGTPRMDDPPPYSSVAPPEIQSLPHAYRGSPVVAFRRSGSPTQDDAAVILSLPAGQPKAAACNSAPEGADLPEAAACGGAPEVEDLPERVSCDGASDTLE